MTADHAERVAEIYRVHVSAARKYRRGCHGCDVADVAIRQRRIDQRLARVLLNSGLLTWAKARAYLLEVSVCDA
jgi:hypothetical protein